MVLSAKAKRQARVVSLPVHNQPPRRKKKQVKYGGPGILLVIILGFALYSFGGQMVEAYNVSKEVKKIQTEMEELKKKNEELKTEIKKLESQSWVEHAAREKLGLVKPGEKLILEVKPRDMKQVTEEERESIEVH